MRSYNQQSESSQSDIENGEKFNRQTVGYGKIAKVTNIRQKYQSSSQSQQSSLSQKQQQQSNHNGLGKVEKYKVEMNDNSQSQQSESSFDHIQERIRRLQMDLQKKIDKQKIVHKIDEIKSKQNQQKFSNFKGSSPPLPKKLQAKSLPVKAQPQVKIAKQQIDRNHRQQKEKEEQYLPPSKKQSKPLEKIVEQQKQVKVISPKKKVAKEKKESQQSKNPSLIVEKKRNESKNSKPEGSSAPHNSNQAALQKKLTKANKHIEQLTKALQQQKQKYTYFRKQNKKLKQKLANGSKPKKTIEDIQKLKQITATNEVKLEKQIQLLKIIQGLQAKLKKSINRKLSKSRAGSTSAVLLHKGLPSSLMN